MAEIAVFPLARRAGLIRTQAARYAENAPRAAENILTAVLDQQRRALLTRGIDPSIADEQVDQLEAAIKAHARLAYRGGYR